jgi:hypothetical protein
MQLGVVVGVDIDEARRHERAVGLEDAARCEWTGAPDVDQAPLIDPDVARRDLAAASVDEAATPNHQVDHLLLLG